MKISNYLLAFAAVLGLAVACKKDDSPSDGTPSMTITPTELKFAANGGELTKTVSVVSNRDWKVSEDLSAIDWLKVTVNGEDINGKVISASSNAVEVSIAVTENTGYERKQNLTFNGGTKARGSVSVSQEGTSAYNTISEVLDAFKTCGKDTLNVDGMLVKATVVSNTALDNLNSNKSLYVQDGTAGINVFCAAKHSCAFGDEVLLKLDGAQVFLYAGAPEISGLSIDNIEVLSSGNPVAPVEISATDLVSGKYEGQYVKVNDVQVKDADLGKTWVIGGNATSINMEAKTGENFVVRSGKYSSFGAETVPDKAGNICGIATTYNGTAQLIFAQSSDYTDFTKDRFQKEVTGKTIAEVVAATTGEGETVGRVIALGTQGFIINDGTTQNLYVYVKGQPSVSMGDIVKVSGAFKTYGGVVEYDQPVIEPSTATVPATPDQTATVLSDNDVAAYTNDGSSSLVEIAGTVVIDREKGYVNIVFAGIDKPQGSAQGTIDFSSYDGVRVKVTGYFIGKTSNYFTVVPTEVKPDGSDYLNITPSGETTVSASTTSVEINVSTNQSWTATSLNPDFTLDTASGEGNGKIVVSFSANTDTKNSRSTTVTVTASCGSATLTITQKAAVEAGDARFVKLSSAPANLEGEYLIVCEEQNVALDGSLSADAAHNVVEVSINSGEIACTEDLLARTFTVETVSGGYALKAASGKYISGDAEKNKLYYNDSPSALTIEISGGSAIITSGRVLQFNATSGDNNYRFRFYNPGSQKPIALYRLEK